MFAVYSNHNSDTACRHHILKACIYYTVYDFLAKDELYLYVGKMIALSILHGGPGPEFFAPVVVDYLFGGISAVNPTIEDVPDKDLQLKIRKVLS